MSYVEDIEEAVENADIDDFEMLEKYFHELRPQNLAFSQSKAWIQVCKELRWQSEDLFNVIMLLLCIPNGTSELERIFSVIKEIKSRKRSKLSAAKLAKMLPVIIFYYFDDKNYDRDELHNIFREEKAKLH